MKGKTMHNYSVETANGFHIMGKRNSHYSATVSTTEGHYIVISRENFALIINNQTGVMDRWECFNPLDIQNSTILIGEEYCSHGHIEYAKDYGEITSIYILEN